jgi:hypothetical protein
VIDHETARDAFATSLDFALEPAERDALDTHLGACVACRSFAEAARSDAAVLRELDLGPVPIAVRANVAIAAEHPRRSGIVGRWIGIAVVGAILIAALGGGALGLGGRPAGNPPGTTAPDAANLQISWKTDVVMLTATGFSIEVGGKTFRATPPKVDVRSDPGDATYRTLETTWMENGVEMRLFLYFANDATSWWVSEVRIYNGAPNGNWLYAKGPLFQAPLGAAWQGDKDIAMTDVDGVGGTPARVRFAGLTLSNRPADLINQPAGGGIALPENAAPFAAGGALHCSGILQMAPKQAEATLLALGYRLSWRLDKATGPNTGFSEVRKTAPDGVINAAGLGGSSGELIMFVAPFGDKRAKPIPFPSDCPASGPNVPPPSAAP